MKNLRLEELTETIQAIATSLTITAKSDEMWDNPIGDCLQLYADILRKTTSEIQKTNR